MRFHSFLYGAIISPYNRRTGRRCNCADHALANAISGLSASNAGQKLENIIYLHLKRKTDKVYYYKTKSGFGEDFAVGSDDAIQLAQVCADIFQSDTFERETRILVEAMDELRVNESSIVARTLYLETTSFMSFPHGNTY